MTRPLVIVSSVTGNTRILALALVDAVKGPLVTPEELPADLSDFNPVYLGFWNDRGMAPENMQAAAKKLSGKRIACFATQGSSPTTERSVAWMQKTAQALCGTDNELVGTFLSQGAIDQGVFDRMTKMLGGVVSPERAATREAASTHPDRKDIANCIAALAPLANN